MHDNKTGRVVLQEAVLLAEGFAGDGESGSGWI